MQNKTYYLAFSFLAAACLLSSGIGCGQKPSGQSTHGSSETAGKTEAAPEAAGVGSIKGVVKFTGTAPTMPDLNRQSDPVCAATPRKAEYVVINDGKLANVAVLVQGAKGGKAAEVTVDQKECMYSPRVQTALVGQEVSIHNSDATLHNVHTYMGSKTLFNRAQPKGSPAIKKKFDDAGIVKFKCDVHPWMTGWLIVGENAFGAVSGSTGEFEIKDVPVGTYKLKAFQEKYGEKEIEIKVEADQVATVEFSYDGTETAAYKYREFDTGALLHGEHHHQH